MSATLSFLCLVTLFGSCTCQQNYCGWFVMKDGLQALQLCQQERGSDGTITSYRAECNRDNDEIMIKWWHNSYECNNNIEASTITHPQSSNFNCNDTQCISPSYLTYKTYKIYDECSSTETIVINNNNFNVSYYETTLITNKCYNNNNITCSNHSYHSCNQLISIKVINNTSANNNNKACNFINTMGYNIPTAKCLTISSTESQIYECNENGEIKWSYYDKSINCLGNGDIMMNPYPLIAIIDWNCNSNICLNNEYMELIIFKTENDCSIDVISDTNYDSHLYLINICMKTQNNGGIGGIIYQCINGEGYTITKYLDSNCLIQDGEILIYNEIECIMDNTFDPPPQRRQHMIFCNGINNIIIEKDEKDKKDYIINCNYFINYSDNLGVIVEPLNICISIKHGSGSLYSKKYQCNKDKFGIEEIVYNGPHCIDKNIKFIISRTEFKDFYCDSQYDSQYDCIHNYVLIGKQYTNDSCYQNEDFWYYQHIIIDKCWPIGNGLYAIISCDENGFVYRSLYNDKQCTQLALHQRFNTFDCIFGKLFQVIKCPFNMNFNIKQFTSTSLTSVNLSINSTLQITTNINMKTTKIYVSNESEIGNIIEDKIKEKKECVNIFGGRDIAGVSCQHWKYIILALIVLVAVIISSFICWCWCPLFLQPKHSKLSIANGNNNQDLQHIVIQQLNKGQHINDDDDDEKSDQVPFSL